MRRYCIHLETGLCVEEIDGVGYLLNKPLRYPHMTIAYLAWRGWTFSDFGDVVTLVEPRRQENAA